MIDINTARDIADAANVQTVEGQALKRLVGLSRRQDILIRNLTVERDALKVYCREYADKLVELEHFRLRIISKRVFY